MNSKIRNYYLFECKIINKKNKVDSDRKYNIIFCPESEEFIMNINIDELIGDFFNKIYNCSLISGFHFKIYSNILKLPNYILYSCSKIPNESEIIRSFISKMNIF